MPLNVACTYEDRLMRCRTVLAMSLALAIACASDRDPSGPASFPVSFVVTNSLVAPVTIAIDGMPYLGLKAGGSSGLTVRSTAQWLTWSSAKPMDGTGRPIADDIAEVKVAIGGISRVLEISNVIDDQTYVTAEIFNLTSAAVSIGVYDGSSVSCAAELPAASNVAGYTRIGYYRLQAATQIRAYGSRSGCTGPYASWTSAELRAFMARSGLLTLTLGSPP